MVVDYVDTFDRYTDMSREQWRMAGRVAPPVAAYEPARGLFGDGVACRMSMEPGGVVSTHPMVSLGMAWPLVAGVDQDAETLSMRIAGGPPLPLPRISDDQLDRVEAWRVEGGLEPPAPPTGGALWTVEAVGNLANAQAWDLEHHESLYAHKAAVRTGRVLIWGAILCGLAVAAVATLEWTVLPTMAVSTAVVGLGMVALAAENRRFGLRIPLGGRTLRIRRDGLLTEMPGLWTLTPWSAVSAISVLPHCIWLRVDPVQWTGIPRPGLGTEEASVLAFLRSVVESDVPLTVDPRVREAVGDPENPFGPPRV